MSTLVKLLVILSLTLVLTNAANHCDNFLFLYAGTISPNGSSYSECQLPVRVHNLWSKLEIPSENAAPSELNQLLQNFLLLPLCDQLRFGYVFCKNDSLEHPYFGLIMRGSALKTAFQVRLQHFPPNDRGKGFLSVNLATGRLIVDRNCKRFAGFHMEIRASLKLFERDYQIVGTSESSVAQQNRIENCNCTKSILYDEISRKCYRKVIKKNETVSFQGIPSLLGKDESWKRRVALFAILCVGIFIVIIISVERFLDV